MSRAASTPWLIASWALTWALFAWQDFWRTALHALFHDVTTPVFERATLLTLVWQHLGLSLGAFGLVVLIGLPLAILVTRGAGRAFLPLASNVVAVGQTFPPTAVLFLALPIFGFGPTAAVLALFLYGLLPVVRGTLTGLESVSDSARDAARGMGMNGLQLLTRLDLPLALPAMLAGLRASLVLLISTATIAPLVGTGGLGVPIIAGLSVGNLALVLQGAVPVALLAILTDWTVRAVERRVTPWQLSEAQ
ncbi:ABC transporter permease [Deinococcus yavapaiensis]|uniref:Osmoprotectant transport system permease protein n=1 Tax=Deinococcus yavapaiensis KR-236 TaxID=694435 RepID=A0A318SIC0_9DEIO|nr:ABC transporter permease [Deinococcus yavapaiensis]PYE51132.1 osmoprotectant transport system permease protein [Deinococcus yavapaiensis KR-236]